MPGGTAVVGLPPDRFGIVDSPVPPDRSYSTMFKKMGLATKMALGFGTLVVVHAH